MKRSLPAIFLLCASSLTGCSGSTLFSSGNANQAQLFDGMGPVHRPITTDSELAQQYFDQGLSWAYAFNHDEAIRSFTEVANLDPECAMAYWGIALCNGPHINNPIMTPERSAAAWAALQQAISVSRGASANEQALIAALSERYADPAPSNRADLDAAYAEAMRGVWSQNQGDAMVCTLYAEAMMDLRPWDLWTKEGEPQPGTLRVLKVLESAMRIDPNNPGANHLYIHAIESSPHPKRAITAANRLRNLVPTSGHLVHMPSHIDVLTGRWEQASIQNELAIQADIAYEAKSAKQGFYRLYMVHNYHMLSFASMMEGRYEVGLKAARAVVGSIPEEYLKKNVALMDPFMSAAYDVLKRFGRWDEMLRQPQPADYLPITTAMWRFNRGVAFAAKGEVEKAEQEKVLFEAAVANVAEDAVMAINPAHKILSIAKHFLNGEIAFRRGEIDLAVSELKMAIEIEDDLMYMEPPEWIQPTRHTLGAVLLSSGRYAEAEDVYREDLGNWPGNGWSLYGLSRAVEAGSNPARLKSIKERFAKSWSRADQEIGSSCLCIPKI